MNDVDDQRASKRPKSTRVDRNDGVRRVPMSSRGVGGEGGMRQKATVYDNLPGSK